MISIVSVMAYNTHHNIMRKNQTYKVYTPWREVIFLITNGSVNITKIYSDGNSSLVCINCREYSAYDYSCAGGYFNITPVICIDYSELNVYGSIYCW